MGGVNQLEYQDRRPDAREVGNDLDQLGWLRTMLASLIVSLRAPIEKIGAGPSGQYEEDHVLRVLNKQTLFDPALEAVIALGQALGRKA